MLSGAEGGNRTHMTEATGFWDQRVYQFRHLGKLIMMNLLLLAVDAGIIIFLIEKENMIAPPRQAAQGAADIRR